MQREIESRYLVPDRALFQRLRQLDRMGSFALISKGKVRIVDYYLDTQGHALLRQGWACRLRAQDGNWLLTLKGPKELQGAIVSRPELEIPLPDRIQDVARWPKGEIRKQVQALTGGLPLQRLVTIKQTRHLFRLGEGSRTIGELSLDQVRTQGKGLRHQSYMLECELLEDGQVTDLESLDRWLVAHCGLISEPRSKLRRALELVEQGGSPDQEYLQASAAITVETLAQRYDIDPQIAQRTADLAQQLYDALSPWHDLPETARSLLRVAALLHDVGHHAGRRQRHIVGRDILLRQPIVGLSEEEQSIIATTAFLSSQDQVNERVVEALPEVVPPALRQQALIIAALVRLARSLGDVSKGTPLFTQIERKDDGIIATLEGERATKCARRVGKKTDLWQMACHVPLAFQSSRKPAAIADKALGIQPTDTMRLACGKALRFHHERMLEHEAGTRLGEDPEELHDMRVATRRMRSALRLFGPYVTGPLVERVSSGLRHLARILGAVRDLDVALERAESYLAAKGLQGGLDPLLHRWQSRREAARRRMFHYLDSRSYTILRRDVENLIAELSSTPPTVDERQMVAYIAPRFLYVDWQIVRAYRAVVEDAPLELLHALRIDCKRLRYGLEFFGEILPPKVVALIPDVVGLQDHLGEMHDAAVAVEMIEALLARRRHPERFGAVLAYRETCRQEMQQRLQTFPEIWERFSGVKMSKRFEMLLSMTS